MVDQVYYAPRVYSSSSSVENLPIYINSATGLDTNNGLTSDQAIKTPGELQKRWAGKTVKTSTTIRAAGTFTAPLELSEAVLLPGVVVNVEGEAPTVQYTGALTAAYTAYAPLTNTPALMVDSGRDYAADINRRVRFTSGAASGSIAWILKRISANNARPGQFVRRTDGRMMTPANGDAYVIETLNTSFPGIHVDLRGGGKVRVKDILFNATVEQSMRMTTGGTMPSVAASDTCVLDGCEFRGAFNSSFIDSYFELIGCHNTSAFLRFLDGNAVLFGMSGAQSITAQGRVQVCATSVLQGATWFVSSGGILIGALDNNVQPASIGVYDRAGVCFDVDVNSSVQSLVANSVLFGSGNTGTHNVRIRSEAHGVWITQWTVTGGTNDVSVGGTNSTFAAITALTQSCMTNPNNGATCGLRS